MEMLSDFREHLRSCGLSENTVRSYMAGVEAYFKAYPELTAENMEDFKKRLESTCKPATVNLRLSGMTSYARYKESTVKMPKPLPLRRATFVENVIEESEYSYLKRRLKADGLMSWHYGVWLLAATGARISEMMRIGAEDVIRGWIDLKSKGGKVRRIYVPQILREEMSEWLRKQGMLQGPIFRNRFGNPISARGFAKQIKAYAKAYGIDATTVYPHSFRHLFAIQFLARNNDLPLLADLMGHSSIETTRIYLRRTACDQRRMMDATVNW